jgi:hypothetical protein
MFKKIAQGVMPFVHKYNWYNINKPFRTAIIQGALITITGDWISQCIVEKGRLKRNKEKYPQWYVPDFKRSWKMFCTGAIIRGPQALVWYRWINPGYLKIANRFAGLRAWIAVSKWRMSVFSVFIDSSLGQPIKLLMFMAFNGWWMWKYMKEPLVHGKDWVDETVILMKKQIWPTLLAGWCYLPWYKIFLYGWCPMVWRNLVDNSFCTVWAVIFAWMMHNVGTEGMYDKHGEEHGDAGENATPSIAGGEAAEKPAATGGEAGSLGTSGAKDFNA